jgi:hypothetical protein
MLPTCFLDDLLSSAKGLLPLSARVPALLLSADGTTLRSCEELQFTTWRDPLAFFMCDLGMCGFSVNSTYLPGLYWDADEKRAQVESADADAYRICALVSSVNSLPVALVLMLCVLLISSLLLTILNTVPPLLTMLWHVASFNHADADPAE